MEESVYNMSKESFNTCIIDLFQFVKFLIVKQILVRTEYQDDCTLNITPKIWRLLCLTELYDCVNNVLWSKGYVSINLSNTSIPYHLVITDSVKMTKPS